MTMPPTTLTTVEWQDLADSIAVAAATASATDPWAPDYTGDTALESLYARVSALAGTGKPTKKRVATSLGPDYIAATAEGGIVAWGAEHVLRPGGQTWREIVVE